jgi:hypothetical protein
MMEEDEYTEILLPVNNKSVLKFLTFPQEKQIQILKLGISIYNYSSQKFKSTIDGEKEDIIETLSKQHSKEIEEMKLTTKSLQHEISDLKRENQQQKTIFYRDKETEINEQKHIIQHNLERLYGEKLQQMAEKIEVLENKKEKLQQDSLSQQKKYYENILLGKQEFDNKCNIIRKECESKIEIYRQQLESFQKINQNSTLKGQKGEDIMYNLLIETFPGCQIDCHTSKEGHKGDFSVIDDTHRGMIESKNYKKNVPKNEIRKFYDDIENNGDIDYAILCSLRSGVANKPQDFTLEFIMGKPVIFIHKVKDNKKSIQLAYTICKLILKNMQCFDITKEENQIKIQQIVKNYRQNHKRMISSLNDHNKLMNEMMNKQFSDFNNILELINFSL